MYRRKVTATLVACLVLVSLSLPGSATPPGNDAIRVTDAVDWVAENYQQAAAENPGFYADAIFAMATAPGHNKDIEEAAALLADATGYYGADGEVNAGALAKTVVALQVAGTDPTNVGGRDLLTELQDLIVREGRHRGRVGSADDVYAAAFTNIALAASAIVEPDVTEWLVAQQCPNGGYSFDGKCPGDPEFFGVDVDTTVMAAHGLETAPGIANRALDWVAGRQDAETGAFAAYGTPNANSTGLGGLGLRLYDHETKADKALDFVLGLQFGPDSNHHGGIRFQPGDAQPDFFATAQGVLAGDQESLFELYTWEIEHRNKYEDVTDDEVFLNDIVWLAHVGVTQGCNPPDGTRFCPDEPITRGELATLQRALTPKDLGFDATPAEEPITRGEVASVLVGVFDLTETSDRSFDDVPSDHPSAEDIGRLAAAGVTMGCNPPDNTDFCPDTPVSRGAMAAFLHRAFDIR